LDIKYNRWKIKRFANFTAACTDATGYHTVEFVNFKPNVDVPILPDRQLVPIIGMMDIKVDRKNQWFWSTDNNPN
jgi:hypothetical protein